MLPKKTLATKLEKEYIESLRAILKTRGMDKKQLFSEAYNYFISKLPKNEIYEEKFNNYDRLHVDTLILPHISGHKVKS